MLPLPPLWLDADPPVVLAPSGGDIAHPSKKHPVAGGVGTANDPATYASEKKALPPGTIVYVVALQK